MASESGDIEAVMSLITAGADINHQNQVEIHMYIIYTVYCTCMKLLLLTIISPTQCIYMCTCTLYVIL